MLIHQFEELKELLEQIAKSLEEIKESKAVVTLKSPTFQFEQPETIPRWTEGRDEIVLSSGKKVDANHGIVGINPDSSEITGGYDEGIFYFEDDDNPEGNENELAPIELCEIANIAIQRWNKFKENVLAKIPK